MFNFLSHLMGLEEHALKAGLTEEDIISEYQLRIDAIREDMENRNDQDL